MRELKGVPDDTSKEVRELMLKKLREMTPTEKLEKTFELSTFDRALLLDGVSHRHPHAREEEIQARFARKVMGEELANKYYPMTDSVRNIL